jgi:hypothetical protein
MRTGNPWPVSQSSVQLPFGWPATAACLGTKELPPLCVAPCTFLERLVGLRLCPTLGADSAPRATQLRSLAMSLVSREGHRFTVRRTRFSPVPSRPPGLLYYADLRHPRRVFRGSGGARTADFTCASSVSCVICVRCGAFCTDLASSCWRACIAARGGGAGAARARGGVVE